MPILGTRSVTRLHAEGTFHCPGCWAQQTYHHRRVQQFFHFLFVPMVSRGQLGEYIECDTCRATYDVGVLNFEPGAEQSKFEAEFERAVKRVLVLMMLADGVLDPAEMRTICEVFERVTDCELTEADLMAEVEAARASQVTVELYVRSLLGRLNHEGKDMVIRAAFLVAAADGVVEARERVLFRRIGQALQMNRAYITALLDSGPASD